MFLFFFPVSAPDRGQRRTVAVFVVAAFDVFVAAAAVAAVFVASGRVSCVGVALLAACHNWQDKLLPPPPPCIILWPAPRWSPWLSGNVD